MKIVRKSDFILTAFTSSTILFGDLQPHPHPHPFQLFEPHPHPQPHPLIFFYRTCTRTWTLFIFWPHPNPHPTRTQKRTLLYRSTAPKTEPAPNCSQLPTLLGQVKKQLIAKSPQLIGHIPVIS